MTRRTALGGLVGLYASVAHAATRLPDLVVSAMSAPSTVAAGDTITVTYTVRNVGNLKAGPSTLACLLSGPPGLQSLGTAPVKALTRGSRTSGSLSVTIPAANPSGSYTLQLVADVGRVVTESNESNNTATRGLTITHEEEPMTLPTLPQVWVDTTMPDPRTGATTHVCTSTAQFATALTNAVLGDIIQLQAGTVFQGPFVLPNKTPAAHAGNPDNSEWIIIRSSAHASLPAAGTRVGPSDASNMARIESPSNIYVIGTALTAHHYRFLGIEIAPASGASINSVILIGGGADYPYETTVEPLSHHLVWDRCYLHGDSIQGARRAITMNGRHLGVIDSYISDCKLVGQDAQGIAGWSGTGPFKIVNNYIEGGAACIGFGGALPEIPNLVPADYEIRQNHLKHPLTWKEDDPSYGGVAYGVKAILETKNSRRMLIDGNYFENIWPSGQEGWAIVITPSGSDGTWATATDLTITNNLFRRCACGISVRGLHDAGPWGPATIEPSARLLIANNVFEDIGNSMGGTGRLLFPNNGVEDLTVEHNTAFQSGPITVVDTGLDMPGFIFRNNIVPHQNDGMQGSLTINTFFSDNIVVKNVIAGPWPSPTGYTISHYSGHPDNFFPNAITDAQFTNYNGGIGGNYQLLITSPYHNVATDGTDIGVDMAALNAALAGTWTPPAIDVDFSATPLSGVTPLNVGFTDTSTGTITSWEWIFGDGGTSTAQHPSHTYTTAGTYTISLNVTGPGGSFSHTKTAYITATAGVPVAAFSGTPLTGMSPLNVAFTDASTGSITSRAWDFGDGGTSPDASPTHTYVTGGTHTVSLTVTGPGGSDAETKTGYVTVSIPKHVLVRLS